MSNRSTVSALIRVLDDWQSALDQGNEVCIVFFGVSKAFDTVPHLPLLQKLSEIGLDPYLIRWIRSYLAGRSHSICKYRWLQLCHPTCTIRCPARLGTWPVVVCRQLYQ